MWEATEQLILRGLWVLLNLGVNLDMRFISFFRNPRNPRKINFSRILKEKHFFSCYF